MTLTAPTIVVYMDLPFDTEDVFIIDDPVRGVIDDTTYLIAGDVAVDLSGDAHDVAIVRGRNFELEDNSAGTATVLLRNQDRDFDGLNTSGTYYGDISAGLRCTISIYDQIIFDGHIAEWNGGYDVSGRGWASFLAVDGLGYLGRQEFDAWTTTAGQDAGARITEVLSRSDVDWPVAQRSIADGVSTLQTDLVTWGSNVLNYLQLVTQSDLGNLFADRNNLITFRNRHAAIGTDPDVTFTDTHTAGTTPFHGATILDGSRMILNRIGIDREGGILQTSEDVASQRLHGIHGLNRSGVLVDTDGEALNMSEFLLGLYMTPLSRVSSVTVNMTGLDADQQYHTAGLDLGDVIEVTWTPLGTGSEVDQVLEVLGIEHNIPVDGAHMMVLRTAPVAQSNPFIIDESLIDSGAVVAY